MRSFDPFSRYSFAATTCISHKNSSPAYHTTYMYQQWHYANNRTPPTNKPHNTCNLPTFGKSINFLSGYNVQNVHTIVFNITDLHTPHITPHNIFIVCRSIVKHRNTKILRKYLKQWHIMVGFIKCVATNRKEKYSSVLVYYLNLLQ